MIVFSGVLPGSDTASKDKAGVVTASITWRFTATASTDSAYDVGAHASCPRIGTPHPDDANNWCVGLEINNTTPWADWQVVANYSNEKEINEDPTTEPWEIDWDGEQFQEPLVVDEDGNAVLNSAGDPFDPPVMKDDSRIVVMAVKNMDVVPTWILQYRDAVNSDTFTIDGFAVAIGQAKMQRPKVSKVQKRNNIEYRTVSLSIHLKEDGWHARPIDVGFRRKTLAGGREKIKMNVEGEIEYPTAPVPLDGAGDVLADPTFSNVYKHDFTQYKTLPYSVFSFT